MTDENRASEDGVTLTETPDSGTPPPAQGKISFAIERIYVRDLSLEVPMGAKTFNRPRQPNVVQNIATAVNKLDDARYEVLLKLTISAKDGDDDVYLVEVEQAGVFIIRGAEEKSLMKMVNVHCPTVLFPYAREVIDNMLSRGNFPPLMLPAINFEGLFQNALAEKQAAKEQAPEQSPQAE